MSAIPHTSQISRTTSYRWQKKCPMLGRPTRSPQDVQAALALISPAQDEFTDERGHWIWDRRISKFKLNYHKLRAWSSEPCPLLPGSPKLSVLRRWFDVPGAQRYERWFFLEDQLKAVAHATKYGPAGWGTFAYFREKHHLTHGCLAVLVELFNIRKKPHPALRRLGGNRRRPKAYVYLIRDVERAIAHPPLGDDFNLGQLHWVEASLAAERIGVERQTVVKAGRDGKVKLRREPSFGPVSGKPVRRKRTYVLMDHRWDKFAAGQTSESKPREKSAPPTLRGKFYTEEELAVMGWQTTPASKKEFGFNSPTLRSWRMRCPYLEPEPGQSHGRLKSLGDKRKVRVKFTGDKVGRATLAWAHRYDQLKLIDERLKVDQTTHTGPDETKWRTQRSACEEYKIPVFDLSTHRNQMLDGVLLRAKQVKMWIRKNTHGSLVWVYHEKDLDRIRARRMGWPEPDQTLAKSDVIAALAPTSDLHAVVAELRQIANGKTAKRRGPKGMTEQQANDLAALVSEGEASRRAGKFKSWLRGKGLSEKRYWSDHTKLQRHLRKSH